MQFPCLFDSIIVMLHFRPLFSPADFTSIVFEEGAYTVGEAESSVMVCAFADGLLERSYNVSFNSIDGTAIGKTVSKMSGKINFLLTIKDTFTKDISLVGFIVSIKHH